MGSGAGRAREQYERGMDVRRQFGIVRAADRSAIWTMQRRGQIDRGAANNRARDV